MNYLIYSRVSPKGSTWASSESSIDMQIQACRHFLQGKPHQIVKDEYYTAKDNNRPGLQGIIKSLEDGSADWDVLIVYRLDRLTRSLLDGGKIFQLLRDSNKGFISVTENIDFSSIMGRAMLGIITIFAQLEREQLGERTRDKMLSMAKKGEFTAGNCPVGYKRPAPHVNVLAIDERPAEMVRDIFNSYASGRSTNELHARYADKLSKNQIINVLKNKHYIGKIMSNGNVYEGKHEPIIDNDLWERVQARLPNREYKSRPAAQKYPYLLTGLVFCHCGKRLTPASYKSGKFHYYKCTDALCKTLVSAPKLEKAVLYFIENSKLNKKEIEHICKEIQEEKKRYLAGNAPELETVNNAITKTKAEIDKTAEGFLSAKNKDFWDDRLFALREELKRLELRKSELVTASGMDLGIFENAKEIIKYLANAKRILELEPENTEAKRNAITSHIKQIKFASKTDFLLYLNDGTSKVSNGCPNIIYKYPFKIAV